MPTMGEHFQQVSWKPLAYQKRYPFSEGKSIRMHVPLMCSGDSMGWLKASDIVLADLFLSWTSEVDSVDSYPVPEDI